MIIVYKKANVYSVKSRLAASVCVCVCVCVFVYTLFTVKVSSIWNDVLDILESTDQRSYVEGIIVDIYTRRSYFTSKD